MSGKSLPLTQVDLINFQSNVNDGANISNNKLL